MPDGDQKPQSKQLQTRAEYLLKLMQKLIIAQKLQEEAAKPKKKRVAKLNDNQEKSQNNSDKKDEKKKHKNKNKLLKSDKEKGSKHKGKDKKKKNYKKEKDKKKDKKKRKHTTHGSTKNEDTDVDLDPEIFNECKEKMRPVKKALKQLDKPDLSLSKNEQKNQWKQCLHVIGTRIDECLKECRDSPDQAREWRNYLWTFVAKFTEFQAKKLYRYYKNEIRGREESGNIVPKEDRDVRYDQRYDASTSHLNRFNNAMKRPPSSNFPSPSKRPRESYSTTEQARSLPSSGTVHPSYRQPGWSYNNSNVPRNLHERDRYGKSSFPRDRSQEKFRNPNERQNFRATSNYSPHSRNTPFSPYGSSSSSSNGPSPHHNQHATSNVGGYQQWSQYDREWSKPSDNYKRENYGEDVKPLHR